VKKRKNRGVEVRSRIGSVTKSLYYVGTESQLSLVSAEKKGEGRGSQNFVRVDNRVEKDPDLVEGVGTQRLDLKNRKRSADGQWTIQGSQSSTERN